MLQRGTKNVTISRLQSWRLGDARTPPKESFPLACFDLNLNMDSLNEV